jgi:hypothetical protein
MSYADQTVKKFFAFLIMNKDLLIRLEIPVPTQPIYPQPGLIFNRWLPLKESDALIFTEDKFEVKLWFDTSCIEDGFKGVFAEDELSGWLNVTVSKVFADVMAADIHGDLADFIFASANKTDISNAEMSQRFEELNAQVIKSAVKYVNRLVTYFRSEKGQYWLEDYRYLYDSYLWDARNNTPFHVVFKAKVKVRDSEAEWVKWNPQCRGILMMPGDSEDKYVKREEWADIYDFVHSSRRPTLIPELLTNAENLANNEHRRSAIIEAVTALEVAINSFSKAPQWAEIMNPTMTARIDTGSFASQVEHLGFSATLRYLIPLLFNESTLPSDLINKCQDAVLIRHDVVHKGQRKIEKVKLLQMIHAIRKTCDILKQYSE